MYEPMVLFYVGVVLILNGLWMLGRIADREILVINALVGGLFLRIACEHAFGSEANPQSVRDATLSLLFAFTYLWVAYNLLTRSDGRGQGWFSLIVAITAMLFSIQLLIFAAGDAWALWTALSWMAWAILWGMFFLLQALRWRLMRPTAWMAIAQGVVTGLLPGLLLILQQN